MKHISTSYPQFLHPLLCVFAVSSTVIYLWPWAAQRLWPTEKTWTRSSTSCPSFSCQTSVSVSLSLFLSVTWSAYISLLIYPSVLSDFPPPFLCSSSHSLKLSTPSFFSMFKPILFFRSLFSSLNECFHSPSSPFMLSFLMLCFSPSPLSHLSVWFIFFILCLALSQRGSCSPPFCESVRVCVCDFCVVYFWKDSRFVWDFQLKPPEERAGYFSDIICVILQKKNLDSHLHA